MNPAVFLLLLSISTPAAEKLTPHIKAALQAFQQGKTDLQNKHLAEAIEQFRNAIRIEPTYLDAFKALIDSYLQAGQKEKASAALTQLLEIEPDLVQDRVLLGQLLLDGNQAQRALAQFSYALDLEPQNADALFGFATSAKQVGMNDRAAQAMEKGRHEHPQDSRFFKQ